MPCASLARAALRWVKPGFSRLLLLSFLICISKVRFPSHECPCMYECYSCVIIQCLIFFLSLTMELCWFALHQWRFFSTSYSSSSFLIRFVFHTKIDHHVVRAGEQFSGHKPSQISKYSQHANGSHIWKWERERCDVSFRIHAFYFIRCVLKLIFVFFFSLFIVLNIFESHKHFKHFNDNNNERKRRRKAREKNNNCKTMLRWRQAI